MIMDSINKSNTTVTITEAQIYANQTRRSKYDIITSKKTLLELYCQSWVQLKTAQAGLFMIETIQRF